MSLCVTKIIIKYMLKVAKLNAPLSFGRREEFGR